MKYVLSILLAAICWQLGMATNVQSRLFINRGQIEAIDSTQFAYLAFNNSSVFHRNNSLIRLQKGDSLIVKVINNDTVNHTFSCQGQLPITNALNPGDSATYRFYFNNAGLFIYSVSNPLMRYLGLGGMISVETKSHAHFFWNIKEHNKAWNDTIAKGYAVNWANYYPDFFLINGNSNPKINQDPVARVTAQVGDTIYICISNTGRSIHSLHLHGYHGTITYSSKFPSHQGREKDTFPLYPMESLIIRLIPDKPGKYPVHDHNLVAVTGGNYYPNGMFLTLLVQ